MFAKEKRRIVKEFYSGISAKELSKLNNVPLSTLYSWINKEKPLRANRESKFTQAQYYKLLKKIDWAERKVEILQFIFRDLNIGDRLKLDSAEKIFDTYSSRLIAEALELKRSTLYNHANKNLKQRAAYCRR